MGETFIYIYVSGYMVYIYIHRNVGDVFHDLTSGRDPDVNVTSHSITLWLCQQFANLKPWPSRNSVRFPINSMVIFNSYVSLEGICLTIIQLWPELYQL